MEAAAGGTGLGPSELGHAFPFHVVFDGHLNVVQTGAALARVCPAVKAGVQASELFTIDRPISAHWDFDDLTADPDVLYLVTETSAGLALRGGMIRSGDSLVYLCSPRIVDLADLGHWNLSARDFPPSDPLADLLFLMQMKDGAIDDIRTLAAQVEDANAALRAQTEDLEFARDAALLAEQAKSTFLAHISHDMRTPLNGIIGLGLTLERETFGPLRAKQADYVSQVVASARHLLAIINDLIDLSLIESGAETIEPEAVAAADVVEAATRIVSPVAEAKNVRLVTECRSGLRPVRGDQRRLTQVLVNLIDNAVKFSPDAGRVVISAEPAEAMVRFRVCDEGPGIPEDHREAIFEPFERTDSDWVGRTEGSGIGLAVCRHIVDMHSGSIEVSGTGDGACFVVEIPVESDGEAAAGAPPRADSSFGDLSGMQVLLADDHETNRMVIRDYLEAFGVTVHEAADGQQAVSVAKVVNPDAILMDVKMPRMNGLEATAKIREDEELAQVPVIAITAYSRGGVAEQSCYEAGCTAFMTKPIDPHGVFRMLQGFVDEVEAGDSAPPATAVSD